MFDHSSRVMYINTTHDLSQTHVQTAIVRGGEYIIIAPSWPSVQEWHGMAWHGMA